MERSLGKIARKGNRTAEVNPPEAQRCGSVSRVGRNSPHAVERIGGTDAATKLFKGVIASMVLFTTRINAGRRAVPWRFVPAFFATCLIGCAGTGSKSGTSNVASPAVSLPAGVDASKALLPLAKLEPRPTKPARPESIAPLSERGAKLVAKARTLLGDQRYTEATLELEKALRYDPNHPDIDATLAQLHWQAGNPERARTHAVRAMEANSDSGMSHYITGRCNAAASNRMDAIRAFRTALLCSDTEADAELTAICHFHLADALENEGYLTAALDEYDEYEHAAAALPGASDRRLVGEWSLEPSADAKARLYERLGRFVESAAALRPRVAASPGDRALVLRYATLLQRAKAYDEALTALRSVPATDPDVLALLFEIHRAAGHPQRIVDELRVRVAQDERDPTLVLSLADVLMRLERPDDAAAELEAYLAKNPDAAGIREKLSALLLVRLAWEKALHVCAEGLSTSVFGRSDCGAQWLEAVRGDDAAVNRLLARDPAKSKFAGEAYLLGSLAAATGTGAAVEPFLRRSLALSPGFIPARVTLGRHLFRQYRYAEALEIAGRPADADPEDSRLEFLLGDILDRLDDTDGAERKYQSAVQLDRSNTDAMLALANLFRRTKRVNLAQRQLRLLLEQDNQNEEARWLLARTYLDDRKFDVAFEQVQELRRLSKKPTTQARCDALLDPELRRNPETRRQRLYKGIDGPVLDVGIWFEVADTYNDFDVAPREQAYRKVLEIESDNEDAMLALVDLYRRKLAFTDAASQLRALLDRRPNRHAWRLRLMDSYIDLQDYDSALALAEERLDDPKLDSASRKDYRKATLEVLFYARRRVEMTELLRTWYDEDPTQNQLARSLANTYVQFGQPDKALPLLQSLYEKGGRDWGLLEEWTRALVKAGRKDAAALRILERLEDDRDNDAGMWLLASILYEIDAPDDALEVARNQLVRTQKREVFQDVILQTFQHAERNTERLAYVESLVNGVTTVMRALAGGDRGRGPDIESVDPALRPDEPYSLDSCHGRLEDLRRHLTLALIAAGRPREAETRLTEWLEATSDSQSRLRYLFLLAAAQRELRDEDRATETLRRALLLDPELPGLNNDVAYGWIDKGVRLDEAETMIRYAVFRLPREGAYLDTFGWLLYKKGQFADAKHWLAMALQAREDRDPVLLDHMGDACWRLGEKDAARRFWKEAAESIAARPAKDIRSADERRVRDVVGSKIESVDAGTEPAIAPLAVTETPGS